MKTRALQPDLWRPYLEVQAARIRSARAEVHVLDPARDRFVETWDAAVHTIAYDAASDELRVVGEQFEHVVAAPAAMQTMEGPAGELRALEVVAGDGIRHIVLLRPGLALAGG